MFYGVVSVQSSRCGRTAARSGFLEQERHFQLSSRAKNTPSEPTLCCAGARGTRGLARRSDQPVCERPRPPLRAAEQAHAERRDCCHGDILSSATRAGRGHGQTLHLPSRAMNGRAFSERALMTSPCPG